LHFVYQPWSGDGQIVARVTDVEHTDDWAKAGVMFRQSLAADALNVFMMLTPQNGPGFQSRARPGGNSTYAPGRWATAPHWLKLARSGDTFTGYSSSNGVDWVSVGAQTIPMSGSILIGIAVTSHNNSVLNTSTFINVRVETVSLTGATPQVVRTSPPARVQLIGRDSIGAAHLRINGESGRTYALETSTDLMNWTPLANRLNSGGTISITDAAATDHFARFYRTVVAP
jgi:hypothetical protein